MGNTDKVEFAQRMKNLDAEEKEIVVKTIPNSMLLEELGRRLNIMSDKISQVREIFSIKETE